MRPSGGTHAAILLFSGLALLGCQGGDQVTSDSVIGKRVIVGLTFQDEDEKLLGNVQYHIRVLRINHTNGLVVERLDGGGVFNLPPSLDLLEEIAPGEYRLTGTGEIVRDPDYALVLTVTVPPAAAEQMRSGKLPIAPEFLQSWSQDPPASASKH